MLIKRKLKYLSDITLPPKEKYNIYDDGITQTLLNNASCRMKLLLWLNGWYNPEKNYKTTWGSLFHHILDKSYTLNKKRNILPKESIIIKWCNDYKNKNIIGIDKNNIPLEDELDILKATIILLNYIAIYNDDFKEQESILIETVFNVKCKDFLLRGKIDREYKYNNNIFLQEHKTKSNINENILIDVLGINFQNLFYSLAKYIDTGILYNGILYNIIRKTTSKPTKKETNEDYIKRLNADIHKRSDYYFKRFMISFDDNIVNEIEQFKNDLLYRLKELSRFLEGKTPIFKNTLNCENPYPCQYLRACASGVLIGYCQKDKLFEELLDNK